MGTPPYPSTRLPIHPRFGCGAEKITKGWNHSWVVETTDGNFIRAQAVVVASGGFHGGKRPPFAENVPPGITQIHSWEYKNPQQLPEGAVLTVGLGQSGTQVRRSKVKTVHWSQWGVGRGGGGEKGDRWRSRRRRFSHFPKHNSP